MMLSVLTHDVIVLIAGLGAAGQVLVATFVLVGVLEVFGVGGPLRARCAIKRRGRTRLNAASSSRSRDDSRGRAT